MARYNPNWKITVRGVFKMKKSTGFSVFWGFGCVWPIFCGDRNRAHTHKKHACTLSVYCFEQKNVQRECSYVHILCEMFFCCVLYMCCVHVLITHFCHITYIHVQTRVPSDSPFFEKLPRSRSASFSRSDFGVWACTLKDFT